jgi:hypothetical protein
MLGGQKSVIEFVKYLISINEKLIIDTALSNCHCVGLNSFIINERPKIRLFVADKYCTLYDKFDFKNPIIPVHSHKYDDIFVHVSGRLIHHLYEFSGSSKKIDIDVKFNKYTYGRLSDNTTIEKIGTGRKFYYKGELDNLEYLKANELHTISLDFGVETPCSWLVFETFADKEFEQIAYHKNLVGQNNLYKNFKNPIHYLNNFFETLNKS